MTPDPTGQVIESVKYQTEFFRLTINTVGGWSLTIENDFILNAPKAPQLDSTIDSEQIVSRLTNHVGGTLTGFDLRPGGGVTVSIDDLRISVEPAHDFEAWHIVGPWPEKPRIICMPGGELAIWS